ncbi:MAG: TonB C-terminal domain-containing protein, partial [Betaproteobacteria bacterium]|nr:TonB C-terminal domain-containing protein [Betaproteobacteria bacterium]
MNALRSDHRPVQAPPRRVLSLVLTIAVHVGLVVFLVYGFAWKIESPGTLEVGLVGAPVGPGPTAALPAPPPEPPKPEPEPPKPEPPPVPEPEPEIATKKPDKKPEPEKPKPKPKPEPEKPKPKPEPEKPKPKPKPEPPLKPIDLKLDQKLDQTIARTAEAKRATDLLEAGGGRQGSPGTGSAGDPVGLAAYKAAIAAKVRRNLIPPPGLSGKPVAVFEIEQVMTSRGG